MKYGYRKIKFNIYNFIKGLIVPLFVAVITVNLGRDTPNNLWILSYNLRQGTLAILLGVCVSLFSYILEKYVFNETSAYEKSILLGLLSAEVMVFSDKNKAISMSTITLLLFFYFHSIEH
jgi:hypothetical protein